LSQDTSKLELPTIPPQESTAKLSKLSHKKSQASLMSELSEVREPLLMEDIRQNEQFMSRQNRKVLAYLRKNFKSITDPNFLDLFEKRYIIFMEDGTDLHNFHTYKRKSLIDEDRDKQ
jgi:hypothetical protein